MVIDSSALGAILPRKRGREDVTKHWHDGEVRRRGRAHESGSECDGRDEDYLAS